MGRTTNFRGRTEAFNFGAYFVDEIAITQWLKIMGGLRFDHFDTDFENKFLRQEFSQINNEFSPRAALIVQPTPQQTYYFSYGTSFNPSAEGLALAINTTSAEPEKNVSYEIGAKWDLFREPALGRHRRLPDRQDQCADDRPGARGHGQRGYAARARLRGVGRRHDPATLEHLRRLHLPRLGGRRIPRRRHRHTGRGQEEIPNVARHTATLWTTWDITDQWQVGGGAFYSSRRFANNINTIEVPWYARGDVTVAYRPVKSFELRANDHQRLRRALHRWRASVPRDPGDGAHLPAHRDLELLTCCCICHPS